MKKTFWVLLFIVLISANLLLYMVNTHQKDKPIKVEEGLTENNVSNLVSIYYILFAAVIIVAIGFIILTLVRQNTQVYH